MNEKEIRINIKDIEKTRTIKEVVENLEKNYNKYKVNYGIENK